MHQTEINTETQIVSKKHGVVDFVTPLGNTIHYDLMPGEKIIVYKRPLKNIICKIDGKVFCLSDGAGFADKLLNEGVRVIFLNIGINLFDANLNFFIKLKYHYLIVLINFLILLLVYILNRERIKVVFFRIKIKLVRLPKKIKDIFFRYAIKNRPTKSCIERYNSSFISSRSFLLLIVIAMIYLASLLTAIMRNQTVISNYEGLRALSALEMKMSGNYVVSTVNGAAYYNKPPVYNYLLLPFAGSSQYPEFYMRLVTVVSVVVLGVVVFFMGLSQFDKKKALFASLLFSTSFLYYSSLSAQIIIDPFFSILIVIMFFLNFKLAEKNNFLLMFICGYLVASVAFLTKGFPALYFLGISLVASCFTFKSFRKIFSIYHLAGILCFSIIIGICLLIYSRQSEVLPFLNQLFFNEPAAKFNKFGNNFEKLMSILSFAGKGILYYTPVLLLFPLLFFKNNLFLLLKDRFVYYTVLLTFLTALPFISGIFYPYYILCIVPLIVISIVKFFPLMSVLSPKQKMMLLLINIIFIILVFVSERISTQPVAAASYTMPVILALALLPFVLIFSRKTFLVYLAAMFVLVTLRITYFNPVVNNHLLKEFRIKTDAERIIEKVNQAELKLYPSNLFEQHASLYYLTYYYDRIIFKANDCADPSLFYLTPVDKLPDNAIIFDSIVQDYQKLNNAKQESANRKLILFKVPAGK